jgi:WD40 repeat protein
MDPFSSIHDTLPGAEGAKKSSTAKDEPKLSITELVSKARRQSKIEDEDIDEEDRERRENSRNSDYLHDMTAHEGHAHAVFCLAFHPEGRLLLSASGDKTVKLWDLQTHKVLATFPEHDQWVYSVAFMHKSMAFATGCDDGRVRIYDNHSEPINHETGWKLTCDLGQGGKHDAANGHRAGVQSVDVSRDDAYVVSGSADMTIKVCALILPP